MSSPRRRLSPFLLAGIFLSAAFVPAVYGQDQSAPAPQPPGQDEPLSEEEIREQYAKSITYMLRRAKLARSLAAEHLLFLGENADRPELHLVEEASQVIAFDLVCSDGSLDPARLDQLATESSYRIAVQASRSPIAGKLAELGQQQSVQARMNLLGDVATTVFMFQVGRRRGLFDSLITDFGREKFCNGMRTNIRERYDSLTGGPDTDTDADTPARP